MKILLLGEYSNVHNTLAEGLRQLGHQVTVASNGDFWKNYPRDIDLQRTASLWGKISFAFRLLRALPKLRGYDVVQLINPLFVEMKAERLFALYRYLRKHNKRVYLCAFGMDYYWVNECRTRKPLRYSDFNLGNEVRQNADALKETADWIGTSKERLNKYIAMVLSLGFTSIGCVISHFFPIKPFSSPSPLGCLRHPPPSRPLGRR